MPTEPFSGCNNLYQDADAYAAAFPDVELGERNFFLTLLSASPGKNIVSAGCGFGRLERELTEAGYKVFGLDNSPQMIARAKTHVPKGNFLVADMKVLPFRRSITGAVISTLLSPAYIADESAFRAFVHAAGELLQPDGIVVLELPLAYHPRSLQGVEERALPAVDVEFSFRYLDVLSDSTHAAILDSEISVRMPAGTYSRRAPLIVHTPVGLQKAFDDAGCYSPVRFYAPYEVESQTDEPPADCLRAIAVASRIGR